MRHAEERRRTRRIATAGIFFQGGAAAIDSGTIVASLVLGLTGSTAAVGFAAAIAHYGWLFPQLFVAYAAQRSPRRMPFYILGAFGRVTCLAGVIGVLVAAGPKPGGTAIGLFFLLWTLYAFVSGIVAVPYNDIVARAVPGGWHSRLLAARFFGGGVLALGVAASAHRLLEAAAFPAGHAAVLALGAVLLLVSALSFVSAGEPAAPPLAAANGFLLFLKRGFAVYKRNRQFRRFVYVRWFDSFATMALPFYVVEATQSGVAAADLAVLLGAQTAGALFSNPLWGWWGDNVGKRALVVGVAISSLVPPILTLTWVALTTAQPISALAWFVVIFFILGAVRNGATIAQLGYLWAISPDAERPAYSGYLNAIIAPAALAPLVGGLVVEIWGLGSVFAASALFATLQIVLARRLGSVGMMEAVR